MKHDLSVLRAAWENLHPGLYRYNTPEQIEKHFEEASKRTLASLSQRQFFVLLSQLNNKVRCGHTFVSYYNQKQIIEDQLFSRSYFPLLFRIINEEFIITHNLSNDAAIKTGDRILRINGIPVKRIVDSLLTVSKSDGRNGRMKQLDNIGIYPVDISPKKYTLFDIFFPLFFADELNDSTFLVTVANRSGSLRTVRLTALTKEQRQNIFTNRYGELATQEKSWTVRPIDKNTVLFRIGDFATYNWKFDFRRFLDSVFGSFKSAGYSNLILDIRQNEGGADLARDEVLSYIINKPIYCFNQTRRAYRFLQIRDSLIKYLRTWDKKFLVAKNPELFRLSSDGLYEEKRSTASCDTLKPKSNAFRGRVYLITDVTNSSATFIMADIVKKENLATIVGEETGGSQQGINGGEILFLYLPNSNIEMDLPLVYQTSMQPRPDIGIKPDYEVKTKRQDIAAGRDPQLQVILKKLIAKTGN